MGQRQGTLAFENDPGEPAELVMPRLSESLPGERRPDRCQACGSPCDLALWREHDEQDRPEAIVVNLCDRCSRKLIEPHPRLYEELARNAPWPGAIGICTACVHRDGLRCAHPDAKANGGIGVALTIARPHQVHLCRSPRRLSGWVKLWPAPAEDCRQREVVTISID